MTKVAAIQMVSAQGIEENINTARRLITEAAQKGAELVVLPEYWPSIGRTDKEKLQQAEKPGFGPIQDFMSSIAKELNIWLIGGTLSLEAPQENKVLNTTLVYNQMEKLLQLMTKFIFLVLLLEKRLMMSQLILQQEMRWFHLKRLLDEWV